MPQKGGSIMSPFWYIFRLWMNPSFWQLTHFPFSIFWKLNLAKYKSSFVLLHVYSSFKCRHTPIHKHNPSILSIIMRKAQCISWVKVGTLSRLNSVDCICVYRWHCIKPCPRMIQVYETISIDQIVISSKPRDKYNQPS